MKSFFEELKNRNVIKEGLAYLVVSWMILQVSAIVFPLLGTPTWVMKTLLAFLVVGFPVWIIIAWLYEITPDGLRRNSEVKQGEVSVTARRSRLNRIIIGALAIAVILLLGDKFLNKPTTIASSELIAQNIPEKSIAVLPFENRSSDSESQFFCDGVMEDILTSLAHFKELKVISRTSSMHYRGTTKKIPEIANELAVAYVLEGSVRKMGSKVRIVAQLINAKEDRNLWANNFDRELDLNDIFNTQSEVALKIAEAMKVNISPEEQDIIQQTPTNNTDAYQLLLKARQSADLRTKEGFIESKADLEAAINKDPKYADAIAELANTTWLNGYYDYSEKEESYNHAITLAYQALSINPQNQRAFSVLANVYFWTNRLEESGQFFEKALKINPNDATTHHHYSIYYDNQGKSEQARFHAEKALDFDPLSVSINLHYLGIMMSHNKLEEVKQHLKKMEILFDDADNQFSKTYGDLFLAEGKFEEAIPYYEKGIENSRPVHGELGFCYAKLGDKAKAKEYLNQVPKSIYDINAAVIHFALEEPDSAYYFLNQCVDNGLHIGVILNDPVFDPYRNQPRYVDLLERIDQNNVE